MLCKQWSQAEAENDGTTLSGRHRALDLQVPFFPLRLGTEVNYTFTDNMAHPARKVLPLILHWVAE